MKYCSAKLFFFSPLHVNLAKSYVLRLAVYRLAEHVLIFPETDHGTSRAGGVLKFHLSFIGNMKYDRNSFKTRIPPRPAWFQMVTKRL